MSTHQLGFALGVRSALQRVTTPYVLILQHDWAFVTPVPIAQLLDAMDREDGCPECVSETGSPDDEIRYPINYVGFVSNRIVEYEKRCVVARGLKAVTIRDFSTSPSIPLPTPSDPSSKTESPLPLCPLYFYFDKNHLARTHHLRHHIFSRGHFQRGDFIEDTYGHTLLTQLKSGQVSLRDSGCWLYYPDQGTVRAVRHLHGRKVAMSGERKGVVKESGEGLRLTRVGKGASSREDEDDFSIFDDSDDDDDGDHDTN
ncbi:hypothetical protein DFS34DRAFT_615162 [Phlyctochytrium arcticum]|nr:hypothetical protein DFS34DRAFT_615162 [Phlyctochytrium arcticum]